MSLYIFQINESNNSEVKLYDFDIKTSLNNKIWDGTKLRSEIKKKLEIIADEFAKYSDIDKKEIIDVLIVGSSANYNWSIYSDIDLHLVIDFNSLQDKDKNFLRDYFDTKKRLWSLTKEVKLKGIEVEMYVNDIEDELESKGVYSIKQNKWLLEPEKLQFDYDKKEIKKISKKFFKKIDNAILENDIFKIEELKDVIKNMRKNSLEKEGEGGLYNLVFKVLRNSGYMEKLINKENEIKSEKLSLENKKI